MARSATQRRNFVLQPIGIRPLTGLRLYSQCTFRNKYTYLKHGHRGTTTKEFYSWVSVAEMSRIAEMLSVHMGMHPHVADGNKKEQNARTKTLACKFCAWVINKYLRMSNPGRVESGLSWFL